MKLVRNDSSYDATAASTTGASSALCATAANTGFGGEAPGLDRVVHAFQSRDVHHPDPVAAEQQARHVEPSREGVEPPARNGLGSPLDPLAALEDDADGRVRLQDLEQVMRVEPGIAVVETDDHPDRHHVVAHGVDERSAELPELRLGPQWPAHGVDHAVERPRDLPHLLHPELPHLWRGVTPETEVVEREVREMPLRAFREHGHPGDEVTPRLEVAELLAEVVDDLVAGADPDDTALLDEQARRRGLAQEHRAPRDSARSASQRPTCDSETTTLPWLRIGGGVGIGSARSRVSTYTCSLPTGP